jgi:hypothetical protein
MSRVTLALGSFLLGVVCMIPFTSHTSTLVHPALAQGQDSALGSSAAKLPTVPPLSRQKFSSMTVADSIQSFDGLNCENCVFMGDELTYAGGEYSCIGCVLRVNRVTLKGAALNTFKFLLFTGAIPAPKPKDQPFDPNKPGLKIAEDKTNTKLTLVSAP